MGGSQCKLKDCEELYKATIDHSPGSDNRDEHVEESSSGFHIVEFHSATAQNIVAIAFALGIAATLAKCCSLSRLRGWCGRGRKKRADGTEGHVMQGESYGRRQGPERATCYDGLGGSSHLEGNYPAQISIHPSWNRWRGTDNMVPSAGHSKSPRFQELHTPGTPGMGQPPTSRVGSRRPQRADSTDSEVSAVRPDTSWSVGRVEDKV